MTPESQDYIDKAREELGEARKILSIGLAKAAARSAYYAAFHAAEALLMERNGRIAKTHAGVRTALAQLLRETEANNRDLLSFLARAYKYKEISDYGVGRSMVILQVDAESMVSGAESFIDRIIALIDSLNTQKN